MNNFLIFSPFFNASPYIQRCQESILNQDYPNWNVLFIDDASTDNGFELLEDNPKFIKIRNQNNLGLLHNYVNYLAKFAKDDDIIVCLDGDDALYSNDVLSYLNGFYNENHCLVTFGQSIWTDGRKGFARPYTESEFQNLRHSPWVGVHLRTFKYKCFKEMMNQDPNFFCFKDSQGDYYSMTGDAAIMYPLMEIAGFDKVKYIDKILYLYNINNPISDHRKNQKLQWDIKFEINQKNPFKLTILEIKDHQDYQKALLRLEEIFDAKPNTQQGDELLNLSKLIENWENKNYPIN